MPRSKPPPGFITIGSGVYISLAHLNKVSAQLDNSAPNVILIFGWMGAQTRHLQHYSRKYSELYPGATQIIIKCEVSFVWTSDRGKQNRLLPVIEALECLGCLPSIGASTNFRARILVHSFSNGGGIQLTCLGRLLSSRCPTLSPSPDFVSALVVDSAPAVGNFRTIGLAFSVAIRNPVARYLALAIIYAIHAFRLSLKRVFGVEMLATRYIKTLLRPSVLPWMDSRTPRLYVFSKKDEMVPWQAVQQHVDTAKKSGLNVQCDVYDESAHVAHMRLDPERYWGSIRDLWQSSCRGSEAQAVDAT